MSAAMEELRRTAAELDQRSAEAEEAKSALAASQRKLRDAGKLR